VVGPAGWWSAALGDPGAVSGPVAHQCLVLKRRDSLWGPEGGACCGGRSTWNPRVVDGPAVGTPVLGAPEGTHCGASGGSLHCWWSAALGDPWGH
jgi:hypothetical protein